MSSITISEAVAVGHPVGLDLATFDVLGELQA